LRVDRFAVPYTAWPSPRTRTGTPAAPIRTAPRHGIATLVTGGIAVVRSLNGVTIAAAVRCVKAAHARNAAGVSVAAT